jgi:hypothetical protein
MSKMIRKATSQLKTNKLQMALVPKLEETKNAKSPEKNNHVD